MFDWEATQLAVDFICGSRSRTGKWSILILAALEGGSLRHNELLRVVDHGIQSKVFRETLSRLQDSGLVTRQVHGTSPISVSYTLTPLAQSLLEPLSALANWTYDHDAELSHWYERRSL